MRICFVTFGNISNHPTMKRATGMAGPLMRMGHEVAIVLEDAPDNRRRVEEECPGVETLWYGRSGPLRDRRTKGRLAGDWGAEIVWCCGLGFRNWVRPGRKKEGKVLALMDHVELVSSFDGLSFPRRVWETLSEWWCLLHFDGHICASRYLEDVFRGRLAKMRADRRLLYSPYAYTRSWLEARRPLEEALGDRFRDRTMVLYMGAFWENYGFYDMIEGFARICEEHPEAVLVMIGGGPEKEGGLKRVNALGLEDQIVFPGYVSEDELTSWFGQASVFLCPLRDTVQDRARCPSKLFMYLPFRRPVVTCAIGEAVELFGEDYPFFFEERNAEDMANRILAALSFDSKVASRCLPDPAAHDWKARAAEFLDWVEEVE